MVNIAIHECEMLQLTVEEIIWATIIPNFCVGQVFTLILEGK